MYYMILDSLGHEKLSISYERDGKVKKYNYPQKYTDKGEPINTIKDSVHIPNEKKKINPLDYFGLCYTIPKTQASPKMDTLLKIWPDPEPDPHKHCNGYQKLYSSGKLLKYEGVFKNCKLWEGKHYKYDLNGLLVKIEIYKEGKYFGDAKID